MSIEPTCNIPPWSINLITSSVKFWNHISNDLKRHLCYKNEVSNIAYKWGSCIDISAPHCNALPLQTMALRHLYLSWTNDQTYCDFTSIICFWLKLGSLIVTCDGLTKPVNINQQELLDIPHLHVSDGYQIMKWKTLEYHKPAAGR